MRACKISTNEIPIMRSRREGEEDMTRQWIKRNCFLLRFDCLSKPIDSDIEFSIKRLLILMKTRQKSKQFENYYSRSPLLHRAMRSSLAMSFGEHCSGSERGRQRQTNNTRQMKNGLQKKVNITKKKKTVEGELLKLCSSLLVSFFRFRSSLNALRPTSSRSFSLVFITFLKFEEWRRVARFAPSILSRNICSTKTRRIIFCWINFGDK